MGGIRRGKAAFFSTAQAWRPVNRRERWPGAGRRSRESPGRPWRRFSISSLKRMKRRRLRPHRRQTGFRGRWRSWGSRPGDLGLQFRPGRSWTRRRGAFLSGSPWRRPLWRPMRRRKSARRPILCWRRKSDGWRRCWASMASMPPLQNRSRQAFGRNRAMRLGRRRPGRRERGCGRTWRRVAGSWRHWKIWRASFRQLPTRGSAWKRIEGASQGIPRH